MTASILFSCLAQQLFITSCCSSFECLRQLSIACLLAWDGHLWRLDFCDIFLIFYSGLICFRCPLGVVDVLNLVLSRYHLRAVCETDSESCTAEEKIAFIHETRHGFGRTALLLSGGAALGSFHLGVVRTLIEHRLLPRVVAGASVGSIICSFAATRTWSELQSFFDDPMPPMHFFESMGSIFATAHRLLTRGAVHEIGALQRKMRQLIGDLTFQEAYDLSGRVLGIAVCSPRKLEPPRCLNYLTSPHVVIWSAVTASCAFPGLFEAQELMAKDRSGHLVPYHTPAQVCSNNLKI